MNATIVWLREDLRIADNPALAEAAELGHPVLAVFVLDEQSPEIRPLGAASQWWLHHSLASLRADLAHLGVKLTLRRGAAEQIILDLADEVGAAAVFWNRRYGQGERAIDSSIKTGLRARGIRAESFQGSLLFEPWTVETGAGKPYTVFTPFYRACLARLTPRSPIPAPESLVAVSPAVSSDSLDEWCLLPVAPDWAGGLRKRWMPGEGGAWRRLETFLTERVANYTEGRDFPAAHFTSELSAHLRWGEISPFQIWHQAELTKTARPELAQPVSAFLREVIWREFSYNLLYFWPDLATQNFNRKFDVFPWRNGDDSALDAWKTGNTGIPIVDAGMRELWQTGYMHNRVRMIAASFLTKNLMIDWRVGEQWFWDTLVDADPANNPASWQWVAGCGADAAPYFRIFNPELQAHKFDPNHEYISEWVPEANAIDLALDRGYSPIVDLKSTRNRALEAYQSMGASG